MASKQTIQTTNLNFDDIKTSLKDYLNGQTEFTDFDFEGSGLSVLLDVLALNTHQNALLANFGLNESFLSTAQTRSAMINHALNLGYVPRSKSGAKATVTLSVNLTSVSPKPASITLPQFTEFKTTVDGVQYTFFTLEEYIGYDRSGTGIFTFEVEAGDSNILISEGVLRTKTFRCNDALERQVYVIPDTDVDLSTITVQVFDTASSDEFDIYEQSSSIKQYNEDTKLFLPVETYNGFYEISFGDGQATGTAPVPGNIIRVQYLSSNGTAANRASTFTATNQVEVNAVSYPLTVNTVAVAAQGAEKESIESIRSNAPLNLLASSRLVTSGDYISIIQSRIPGIKSVNAWGGEDNVPAKYGKVIVSLIYENDVSDTQKTLIRNSIRDNITDPLSIISVDMEFVDPTFTFLNVTTEIKYDKSLTNRTVQSMQNLVKSTVASFASENLGKFNDVFRKSKLTTAIDNTDAAILSSKVSIEQESRFEPLINPNTNEIVTADYEISFLNTIAQPDTQSLKVRTDLFTFNNTLCRIVNRLGSTVLQIIDQNNAVLKDNIGYYEPDNGKVFLTGFKPTSINSGNSYIRTLAIPADDSVIKPLRGEVISLGENLVSAIQDVDVANSVSGTTN
jgi:hypothetical protein